MHTQAMMQICNLFFSKSRDTEIHEHLPGWERRKNGTERKKRVNEGGMDREGGKGRRMGRGRQEKGGKGRREKGRGRGRTRLKWQRDPQALGSTGGIARKKKKEEWKKKETSKALVARDTYAVGYVVSIGWWCRVGCDTHTHTHTRTHTQTWNTCNKSNHSPKRAHACEWEREVFFLILERIFLLLF
jgi:hypothetical protein